MNWNKLRKQLESFLSPSLEGVVSYAQAGYRYRTDKKTQCYLLVDKKEVMNQQKDLIEWFENDTLAKKYLESRIQVDETAIEAVRKNHANIPEERLEVIAKNNQVNEKAKEVFKAQQDLYKTDFQNVAAEYLKLSVDECLNSHDIILNILAIMDRRVGKNRLKKMDFRTKHPAVQYFYDLRIKK